MLPEVGDEVLVAFEQGDFARPDRARRAATTASTPCRPGRPTWSTAAPGRSTAARWCRAAATGSTCSTQDGKTEGVRLATTGDKLGSTWTSVGTTITVHADGKVLVEGSQGITIDAASADLDLKGGKISLKATNGVTVDGGGGAVSVKAGAPLSLTGATRQARGQRHHRGQGRRDVLGLRRHGQDQLARRAIPRPDSSRASLSELRVHQ